VACNKLTFLKAIEHGSGCTGAKPSMLGKFRRSGQTFEEDNAKAFHVRGINAKHLANNVTKEYGADAIFPRSHNDLLLQVIFIPFHHVDSPRNYLEIQVS
jgi:hypothetical protein